MNKLLLISIFSFFLSSNPNVAFAYCLEPSAPYNKPSKPSVPYCVNEWNRTHTCDDWVINNYYSELDSYNQDVEFYIMELNNYIDDAVEYAECEVRNLD